MPRHDPVALGFGDAVATKNPAIATGAVLVINRYCISSKAAEGYGKIIVSTITYSKKITFRQMHFFRLIGRKKADQAGN